MAETSMVTLAENLNVSSKEVWGFLKEKEPQPLRKMVEKIASAEPDRIDVNLGSVRRDGPELMSWVVNIVQEVTDIPLALDAFNIEVIEAGLKVCRESALINSILIRPDRYEKMLPLVKTYNADYVALLMGPQGLPRDANEQAELITELLTAAQDLDIPVARAWIDPVITPNSMQSHYLEEYSVFFEMLPHIVQAIEAGGAVKSTCGLSNISIGWPRHLRPLINQVYLCMMKRLGLYSCLVNVLDPVIMNLCRGRLPWFSELVYGVMDGRDYDLSGLKKEEVDIIETTNVILGRGLFSESLMEADILAACPEPSSLSEPRPVSS